MPTVAPKTLDAARRPAHSCTLLQIKRLRLTLVASLHHFPERRIKGCVHKQPLCSLKCSRAATDPQILTSKPSGGKSKAAGGSDIDGGRGVKKEGCRPGQRDGGKNVLRWVLSDF